MSLKSISEIARRINEKLEELPPPEVSVHPDVLTRRLTPREIEEEEIRKELVRRSDPLCRLS